MSKILSVAALVIFASSFTACLDSTNSQNGLGNAAANNTGGSDTKVVETEATTSDDPPLEPVVGEITDDGLTYVVEFKRGKGSLKFSRQNGYLRIDADVNLPYYSGSPGQSDWGSSLMLALSVDGVHGRQFVYYPNPAWALNEKGSLAPYRLEASYSKDKGQSVSTEAPNFGARSNVQFWDRWQATLFFDLRYIITPGNTPSSVADDWLASVVIGNQAGLVAFPTGTDAQNPAKTVSRMLKFKVSELPEREEEDEDPIELAEEFFNASHAAMTNVKAQAAVSSVTGMMDAAKAFSLKHPKAIWPLFLTDRYTQIAIEQKDNPIFKDVPLDREPNIKALVQACPGEMIPHDKLLEVYLDKGKNTDAAAHYKEVVESPLCEGSELNKVHVKLRYAALLSNWGLSVDAQKIVKEIEATEIIKKSFNSRLELLQIKTAIAEHDGDSEKAFTLYANFLKNEAKDIDEKLRSGIEHVKSIHKNAMGLWAKELEFQKADAKKVNPRWTLETSKGKIVIELFEDDSPNNVASIVKLTQDNFFDGLNFHRVIASFMAQGGCPEGTGTGSPGYRTKFEDNSRRFFKGTVGMARGPSKDSQGSQFYICFSSSVPTINLADQYLVVGRVIEGMENVNMLRIGDTITTATVSNLRAHAYVPDVIKD